MNSQKEGPDSDDDIIGYREAARLLGVPRGTLYAWTHRKQVPHIRLAARLVRFRRSDLVAFLDARTVPAAVETVR